jgi:protein-S-isoprenylcysteine O-methyltransferase Ste14
MAMRLTDIRPPRVAQGLLLCATLAHFATPMGRWILYSEPVAGAAVGVLGVAVTLAGWRLFKQSDTALCPSAPAERLLTSGIYRYSRNPMYLGMTLIVLAIALAVGSAPFYVAAAAMWLILHGAFIPFEERKLEAAFGDDYLDYKARVRRWV